METSNFIGENKCQYQLKNIIKMKVGGQTVGEAGIYMCDYERWLREGKKIEQNAGTWD